MPSDASEGTMLVWLIAAREAELARHEYIELGHFLIGLCKAEEVAQAVGRESLPNLDQVLEELAPIGAFFGEVGVDPVSLRREMRGRLGTGEVSPAERMMHRSDECRGVFAEAEAIASLRGSRSLQPVDLLAAMGGRPKSAPTRLLQEHGVEPARLQAAAAVLAERSTPIGAPASPEAEAAEPRKARSKTPLLDRFGRDLTALAREGKLDPVIGRVDEMNQMVEVLARKRKSNPIVVGDSGVGKTCVVEGLAQRIAGDEGAETLRGKRLVELNLGALVAGTRYRGEFEERLDGLLREVSANPDTIVFIDEIHNLVGAGSAEGALDGASILKPALARGDFQCIGATTTREYRRYIEKDPALERRFERVFVDEPSREEAIAILQGLRPSYEAHHGVRIRDEAIGAAVELTTRYLPDRRLPDKAVDLMDQAGARARLRLAVRQPGAEAADAPEPPAIGREAIAEILAEATGVPVERLAQEEAARLLQMEAVISRRVIGQPDAVRAVCTAVRTAKAGLKHPRRPVGVFLFLGPTGTGKTELAKALAEFLFDDEARLIRFDMSEYAEKHTVARLLGAPPGYVGYEEEGQLSSAVRTHPYSVVLFDEVEKAHPQVLDIFLQIFDEGWITDSQGRRVDFSETIIILTSNLGSDAAYGRRAPIGIALGTDADAPDPGYTSRMEAAAQSALRPELFNRLQKVVVFHPLGTQAVRGIIDKIVDRLNQRLAARRVTLRLSPEAYEVLMREGFSEEYGAREMERTVGRLVEEPLGEALLQGRVSEGEEARVTVDGGKLVIGRAGD